MLHSGTHVIRQYLGNVKCVAICNKVYMRLCKLRIKNRSGELTVAPP